MDALVAATGSEAAGPDPRRAALAIFDVFDKWFVSQQGYTAGATKMWEEHAVWKIDPVLEPFKKIPVTGRLQGYAGPPNQKAAEAGTKYIIVDMYAKAIQGMVAEESVKLAHDELVKIYGS